MTTKQAGKQLAKLVEAVETYINADSDGANCEVKAEAFTKMKAELDRTRPAVKVLTQRFP